MNKTELMAATCRVALAAYLHDLGKFAERARLDAGMERIEIHEQMYCRRHEDGGRTWYTHKHAAYTALAWDLLEKTFPELLGDDVAPFAGWNRPEVDDSIVNAAARHHKPDTFLQWIVATADRVASGFEREEYEKYNKGEHKTSEARSHYTARQLTLYEQIRLEGKAGNTRDQWRFRYHLGPLSVASMFPEPAEGYETDDNSKAQAEYRKLWRTFRESLSAIPRSHRSDWPLWLDHFDSAWACYTQAIPSATAFGVRPEVSLYDHSRTTSAIATALWRYHHDRNEDTEAVRRRLADYQRPDWDEKKLLLVQGDFFGIQDFIFATGGETQRRAAKLLRGRSFYVSLLTECAALRIMEELALPPTSQVINAAGKFLIVAPNTEQTVETLSRVQKELDHWFLAHCYGQSGIGLASLPAACNDFLRRKGKGKGKGKAPFTVLIKRLFEQLQTAKTQRYGLCEARPAKPLFEDFLDRFDNDRKECAIDGRSPGIEPLADTGRYISTLAADQINVGKHVAHNSRMLITNESLDHNSLRLPVFGYHIQFTTGEEDSGRFGRVARSGGLRRAWDFSLPRDEGDTLFNGYARRSINGHVPTFGQQNAWLADRYAGRLPDDLIFDCRPEEPKTLEHLACDDRWPDAHGAYQGTEALVTLKGDVDNLGSIMQKGLEQPDFAKMSALSRQMNAFFAVWLPWYCQEHYPSTYTVFAGGDDFFLIGPWRSTMQLAQDMREAFGRYVAHNPDIHFSAGLAMTKPGLPIRQMEELGERALQQSKDRRDDKGLVIKDGVTCFGHTIGWDRFRRLWAIQREFEATHGQLQLSIGYLYGLQYLADMAERLNTGSRNMEDALWISRFTYRTRRMLEQKRGMDESTRRYWQQRLGELIAGGIGEFGGAFKIALFTHLYHHRH